MAKSDSKRGADRRPKGGNGTRERTTAKAAKAKPGKASKAVKSVAVKAVTVKAVAEKAAAAKSAAKPAKRGKGDKSAKLNGASTALLEAPVEAVPAPKSEEPAAAATAPTAAAAEVATPETSQDSAKGSKKAATASKASKSAARPSRPVKRKAELLVEQVAAEIVAAELDRELGGGAAGTDAELSEAVLVEAVPVESVVVEAEPVEVGVKTEAVLTEAGAQEKDGERKPLSPLLRYTSVALAGGDPATAVGQDVVDPASTPGVASRQQAEAELKQLAVRLGDLQERLFAAARGGDSRSRVLLILQGMDTSGKGGTVRHVAGQLDPNGLRVSSFKAPTEEELAHDFLWRIRRNAPEPGVVGVFDRSQYEDVLVARVRKLALPMVIGRRYLSINKFERDLAADGCTVVKCFLHISSEEQKRRLAARLEDPTKHWKYSPTDVDDRRLWPQYQDAYRLVLEKTSTEQAPWHIVPADRKWYRNYAITRLLVEALEGIDPKYPPGEFDLEVERKRVAES